MLEIEGDIFYIENGYLHREKGPAIIFKNGNQWWMNEGKIHRIDGPAIIGKTKEYWIDGKRADEEETVNIKRNYWIKKMINENK